MDAWQRLDPAEASDAAAWLLTCCGSRRWAERMIARRPFRSQEALLRAAREEWFALSRADWMEAFGHHPRLGDRDALRARFPASGVLSEQEQSSIAGASDEEIDALAAGNRAYEETFGYIFLACASGQPAAALLSQLHARLRNDPSAELVIATEEQAKITALRLSRVASSRATAR